MTYRFAYKPYRRDLAAPLRTAHGAWTTREGLLVRLESVAGRVGYGEVAPLPWFGTETLDEATALCTGWAGKVNDDALDAVPERMGCVRFALSVAKAGFGDPALQPSQRLPVAALLPAGRAAMEKLPEKLEQGFLCLKWKVGVGDAADELGVLDDLLGALPAYVKLRLDANGAWDRRTAERWLSACAERPVEFVEQPVSPESRDVLRGLAADYPVKLALDESIVRLDAARRWQTEGWPGIFVIKPALCGPLSEIAAWVRESKTDVVISSAIETVVGKAAILRWALSTGVTTRALGFGTSEMFGSSTWDGPAIGPLVDDGWIRSANPEELWNALN